MNKAYAVPLHELLAGVPRDTRLEITDPDGYGTRFIPVGRYCHEAAEALRAALAQPEPEPVAWWHDMGDVVDLNASGRGTPLYFAPPQREWQGLTDEEIREGNRESWVTTQAWESAVWWAEEKLKEKNT
jgi:hypothetical protein